MGRLLQGAGVNIHQLDIYRDGIIVIAQDTNAANKILDDFVAWAIVEFELDQPVINPYKTYFSNLVVEFERSPERLFNEFGKLASVISSAYQTETNGYRGDLRIWRVALMADPGLQMDTWKTRLNFYWSVEPIFRQIVSVISHPRRFQQISTLLFWRKLRD